MSAYEELKAWCEKHLETDEYRIVEKTSLYFATIYLIDQQVSETSGMIYFFGNGEVAGISNYTEDEMIEHINEVECKEKSTSEIIADPPTTPISEQIMRKMIVFHRRQSH